MKDGFYLSTYLYIDKLFNILGISKRHDPNIALWRKKGKKIELVHYWELERVSGMKNHPVAFYDKDSAIEIINKLLLQYDLTIGDMIEVWGTPEIHTSNDYFSCVEDLGLPYHSVSHLFSAIMLDTDIFYNQNIIGMAIDCGPDTIIESMAKQGNLYAGCYVKKGEISMFPVDSPGGLWELSAAHLKLKEGTLMALASASKSRAYLPEHEVLQMRNSQDMTGSIEYFNEIKRSLELIKYSDKDKLFNEYDPLFTEDENKASMFMKEIQEMSLKILDKNLQNIITKYSIDPSETYLALSGGYALNCPSNSHMMQKYGFKGFIAPPCVSDTGQALGIGLYAFYIKEGKFDFKLGNPYYGDCDNSIEDLIKKEKYRQFIKQISEFSPEKCAEDIKEEPIIWFDGASEVGPRALGNRSIIGDPRNKKAKDQLNIIKKRQWWRPVAPIILEECLDEWFEDAYESPLMLHTFKARENKKELIPAIIHIDSSARVQTISKETPLKKLYSVIKSFYEDTGVPIICNTSLNDRGEPIINKIEEAFNFALRKNIKVAYINGARIELHNHHLYTEKEPLERGLKIEKCKSDNVKKDLEKLNPHNVSEDILFFYSVNRKLYDYDYDLTDKNQVRELIITTRLIQRSIIGK